MPTRFALCLVMLLLTSSPPIARSEDGPYGPTTNEALPGRCGFNCTLVALRSLGRDPPSRDVELDLCGGQPCAAGGLTRLADVAEVLQSNGLYTYAAEVTGAALKLYEVPAILCIDPPRTGLPAHFVFTYTSGSGTRMLVDPPMPAVPLALDDTRRIAAVLVSTGPFNTSPPTWRTLLLILAGMMSLGLGFLITRRV